MDRPLPRPLFRSQAAFPRPLLCVAGRVAGRGGFGVGKFRPQFLDLVRGLRDPAIDPIPHGLSLQDNVDNREHGAQVGSP